MSEKNVDLSRSLRELASQDSQIVDFLAELGFEGPDQAKTIPELCEDAGIDLSIVAMALMADGYEVEGYQSPDGGATAQMVDKVLSALFDAGSDAIPDGSSSQGPMYAHMEAAVRRAQESGELPKSE